MTDQIPDSFEAFTSRNIINPLLDQTALGVILNTLDLEGGTSLEKLLKLGESPVFQEEPAASCLRTWISEISRKPAEEISEVWEATAKIFQTLLVLSNGKVSSELLAPKEQIEETASLGDQNTFRSTLYISDPSGVIGNIESPLGLVLSPAELQESLGTGAVGPVDEKKDTPSLGLERDESELPENCKGLWRYLNSRVGQGTCKTEDIMRNLSITKSALDQRVFGVRKVWGKDVIKTVYGKGVFIPINLEEPEEDTDITPSQAQKPDKEEAGWEIISPDLKEGLNALNIDEDEKENLEALVAFFDYYRGNYKSLEELNYEVFSDEEFDDEDLKNLIGKLNTLWKTLPEGEELIYLDKETGTYFVYSLEEVSEEVVDAEGDKSSLSPRASQLYNYLKNNENSLCTYSDIEGELGMSKENATTLVSTIRQVLGLDCITTVRGKGFLIGTLKEDAKSVEDPAGLMSLIAGSVTNTIGQSTGDAPDSSKDDGENGLDPGDNVEEASFDHLTDDMLRDSYSSLGEDAKKLFNYLFSVEKTVSGIDLEKVGIDIKNTSFPLLKEVFGETIIVMNEGLASMHVDFKKRMKVIFDSKKNLREEVSGSSVLPEKDNAKAVLTLDEEEGFSDDASRSLVLLFDLLSELQSEILGFLVFQGEPISSDSIYMFLDLLSGDSLDFQIQSINESFPGIISINEKGRIFVEEKRKAFFVKHLDSRKNEFLPQKTKNKKSEKEADPVESLVDNGPKEEEIERGEGWTDLGDGCFQDKGDGRTYKKAIAIRLGMPDPDRLDDEDDRGGQEEPVSRNLESPEKRGKAFFNELEDELKEEGLDHCVEILRSTLESAFDHLGDQVNFVGETTKNSKGLKVQPNDVYRRLFEDSDTGINYYWVRSINEMLEKYKLPYSLGVTYPFRLMMVEKS